MAFDPTTLTDNELRIAKAMVYGLPDRLKTILRAEWNRRDLGNTEKHPDPAPPVHIKDLDEEDLFEYGDVTDRVINFINRLRQARSE